MNLPQPHNAQRGPIATATGGSSLADVLERVLDKGIVIAGDISVSVAQTELLNIRIRLLISSVDKAREIGINWWENNPHWSAPNAQLTTPNPSQNQVLNQPKLQSELQSELQLKFQTKLQEQTQALLVQNQALTDRIAALEAQLQSPIQSPVQSPIQS